MIGKTPKEYQMSIFEVALESFIDMNHELVLLSKQIDWDAVESEFAEYYCVDHTRSACRKVLRLLTVCLLCGRSGESRGSGGACMGTKKWIF